MKARNEHETFLNTSKQSDHMPPAPWWQWLAGSFLANRGQPSAPGDLLLPLDLQSFLPEERLQASAAVNVLQIERM